MMNSLLRWLEAGLGYSYAAYNSTILGFGRQHWTYVLIAFAVFGCLCMRGLHRRL